MRNESTRNETSSESYTEKSLERARDELQRLRSAIAAAEERVRIAESKLAISVEALRDIERERGVAGEIARDALGKVRE